MVLFVELSVSITFCPPTEFLWNGMFAETKMNFPKGYGLGCWHKCSHYVSDWDTHLFPPGPWAFPIFHALAKGQVPTLTSHFYTLESAESFWILCNVLEKNSFVLFIIFRATRMSSGIQSGNIILNKIETRKSSPCCIIHAISISNVFPLSNCFSPESHSARDN